MRTGLSSLSHLTSGCSDSKRGGEVEHVKNILITGGAGYIGSHTAKLLRAAGYQPVALDNLSVGTAASVRYGPLEKADIGDRRALCRIFCEHHIRAVIHFAAHAYVGESMREPQRYFSNNVVNTLHLLDAMRESGVNQIVFSSSCATYGIPEALPIIEDHPQRPVNPYGESKLFIERALRWYGQAYQLRWVALRYFNAAGADPAGELGEIHHPETHLIPRTIFAALGTEPALKIYGTDYQTADGTCVRDYIHVADLARAHLLALQYLEADQPSAAFNLGTGRGHSVAEVVAAVERVAGRRVPVVHGPPRAGDPATLVADASRAAAALQWRPEFTSLGAIVDTAWRWHVGSGSSLAQVAHG
jgi:UDP-arabinose 4-epimerase